MQGQFRFEEVARKHIPLLFAWLNAAHIKGVYDNGYATEQDVENKYLAITTVQRFVVYEHGRPFGYIQSYDVGHSKYAHHRGKTVGVDLFIGETDYLKKGYGLAMLGEFVSALPFGIERILVDPLVGNWAAIRLFEKYGFVKMEEIDGQWIMGINVRKAVRGIVLDARERVLLIQMKANPKIGIQKGLDQFWLTPGGKIEPGENAIQALHREIKEEVGIQNIHINQLIYADERLDIWDGFPLRLFNQYFLVKSFEEACSFDNLMEDEKQIVLDYKWWSLRELETTQEAIFPRGLAQLIHKEKNR